MAVVLWVPTAAVLVWADRGSAPPADEPIAGDTREEVRMLPEEREFVLWRMRENLVAMHKILEAAARDDMRELARLADETAKVPFINIQMPSLRGVIPPPWRQLGKLVHGELGDLAKAAERDLPKSELPERLAKITAGCVSCHNTYRIGPEDPERPADARRRFP
ncbi:MAG: hypothetical protein CME06_11285 [Gemmatimonadetes bacterium]|nr:hypothetical protein [Gemmatimonadota bacterium]